VTLAQEEIQPRRRVDACSALQYNASHGGPNVEAQVTVRIPEDLKRALDEASRAMQRKNSEIVRMALRAFLEGSSGPVSRPADGVRGLLGSLESGMPHLAERHREYVLESLKNGR
jgi:Arc/MetJ-type ribon-helix-helix transcriptional regulator